MKTKQIKSASHGRNIPADKNPRENSEKYVTVGSSMNEEQEDEEQSENRNMENFGYPDFFEDADYINHYLW